MTFVLLLCLAAIPTKAESANPQQKPNIILVMPDDLGYGDYACLGNPVMRTPSVDAFKKESLLLTQFHVSPTCSPTRSALMSGRHEFKNGVTHTIHERDCRIIPAPGSGGWGTGGDQSPPVQLYNLANDLGETKNLAAAMSEKVTEMKTLLKKLITDGRSTPGAPQQNDVEVVRYPLASGTKKTNR